MTQGSEVRKAREWDDARKERVVARATESGRKIVDLSMTRDEMFEHWAEFANHCLKEELEGLAREFCLNCKHFGTNHSMPCEAAPIRRRLNELQEGK